MQDNRAMIAFYMPQNIARALDTFKGHFPPGSNVTEIQDYHVTLAHLTEVQQQDLLREVVQGFAQNEHPISGQIGGTGRFTKNEDDKNPFYTSLDAPILPDFRQRLVKKLDQYGFLVSKTHGFIPHCTMAYIPLSAPTPSLIVPKLGITFDCVWLVRGDDRERFSLRATEARLKKRLGTGANALRQVLNYGNA